MKDTIRKHRLDLYDKLYRIRDEFDRIAIACDDERVRFRANYQNVEMQWIIHVSQRLSIKWLKIAIEVNMKELESLKSYRELRNHLKIKKEEA